MCVRKSKNIRIFIFYQHITVIFLFKGEMVSKIVEYIRCNSSTDL